MQSIKKRMNGMVLALVAMVLGLAGFQAYAMRTMMMAPSVIATVDIVRAFNALDERAALERDLTAELQRMTDENAQLGEAIKVLQEDLEDFAPGGDKYKERDTQLLRKVYEYQAAVSYIQLQRERRLAEITLKLYRSIRHASRRLAEARGIDIVFVDDTKVEITMGSETDITRQISARRMLYVNPQIEVTDELISLMNREYQQGPRNRNDG